MLTTATPNAHHTTTEWVLFVAFELNLLYAGFVKLLRLRRPSDERVLLPASPHPLGGPLRACYFGPTRESFPHLLTIVGC